MDAKPLTKEERRKIDYYLDGGVNEYAKDLIDITLSAETYWREAVKNAPETGEDRTIFLCNFCDQEEDHKPGCPWLLAQE